jgi:hypothetical protein
MLLLAVAPLFYRPKEEFSFWNKNHVQNEESAILRVGIRQLSDD